MIRLRTDLCPRPTHASFTLAHQTVPVRLITPLLLCIASVFLCSCSFDSSTTSQPDPSLNRSPKTNSDSRVTQPAKRIISLDYCADQYVLQLADSDQIVALSPDADASYSYLRKQAAAHSRVLPRAENIISLDPDLVIRSYGGGPNIVSFLQRANVEVVQLPWISDVDGEHPNTAPAAIRLVAAALGKQEDGEALIAEYRRRLANIPHRPRRPQALYMSAAGVTTGPGSLVHEMLLAAGLDNFQRRGGWRALPLEELAYNSPELTAAAFFGSNTSDAAQWSAARHPIASKLRALPATIMLDGASTACGGWFIADTIEALAEGVTL